MLLLMSDHALEASKELRSLEMLVSFGVEWRLRNLLISARWSTSLLLDTVPLEPRSRGVPPGDRALFVERRFFFPIEAISPSKSPGRGVLGWGGFCWPESDLSVSRDRANCTVPITPCGTIMGSGGGGGGGGGGGAPPETVGCTEQCAEVITGEDRGRLRGIWERITSVVAGRENTSGLSVSSMKCAGVDERGWEPW